MGNTGLGKQGQMCCSRQGIRDAIQIPPDHLHLCRPLHILGPQRDSVQSLCQLPWGPQPYLWMAKSRARAATVFSPPDKLSIGRKRLPGATQL